MSDIKTLYAIPNDVLITGIHCISICTSAFMHMYFLRINPSFCFDLISLHETFRFLYFVFYPWFYYSYVGRNTSSSTATGNKYVNLEEQELLVKNAFTWISILGYQLYTLDIHSISLLYFSYSKPLLLIISALILKSTFDFVLNCL